MAKIPIAMTDEIAVRALEPADGRDAVRLINEAARWYADFLPADEVVGPEMTVNGWAEEARRMTWYGAFDGSELVGVMGLEPAGDAVLLRHAYVRPDRQRQGIATALHAHLESEIQGVDRIIVGTYADNYKARAVLEKLGYQLSDDSDAVLRRYYAISEERLRSSVTYERPTR